MSLCVSVGCPNRTLSYSNLTIAGDTPFCEHRQTCASPTNYLPPGSPEWIARDDSISDDSFAAARSLRQRNSIETFGERMSQRVHRRWPSISKRWRDRKPTTSISSSVVRSAPPSRSSSMRQSSLRESLATHLERRETTQSESCSRRSSVAWPKDCLPPLDLSASKHTETSFEDEERPPTPLLPPIMAELRSPVETELESPLQSPTVASHSELDSVCNSPLASPIVPGLLTPPLSSKPSFASINMARSGHIRYSGDTPRMEVFEESDPWAHKLGHANFHIVPEPYVPDACDRKSCNQLVEDWESARRDYVRQAAHISEHYGPTSRTFKLAGEKWSEINKKWQMNLERANQEAEARGETPASQKLAEDQKLPELPSLVDSQHPDKLLLEVNEADIVGPMVKYAKPQPQPPPPRKHALLRLFTDPASLLSGRPSHGAHREY